MIIKQILHSKCEKDYFDYLFVELIEKLKLKLNISIIENNSDFCELIRIIFIFVQYIYENRRTIFRFQNFFLYINDISIK